MLLAACLYNCSSAQQNSLSGKVVNAVTGFPVEAASVYTSTGTVVKTDVSGIFLMSYPVTPFHLYTSAVGFKADSLLITNIPQVLLIRLQPVAKLMDEVTISTGYQQLPAARATGSFEVIDNKLLNRSVSTDIIGRLEGVTSGLYFNNNRGVRQLFVRGLSTLRASTEPLIILDNFPYDGNLENIDPDNIDNITLLRDASAASIWGAKAANGVLVITSKKGKYNRPQSVAFNTTISMLAKPKLEGAVDFMQPADFMGVEKMLFDNGFYNGELNDVFNYPTITPLIELLAKQRAGLISAAEVDAAREQWNKEDLRKQYSKYFYRKALSQQYTASLSGGSSSMNYLFGVGYDKTAASLKGNQGQRANINLRINLRPVKKLEIQSGLVYTLATDDYNGINKITPGVFKPNMYPYARLADTQGNALAVLKDYRSSYTDTAGGGNLLDWKYRPLDELGINDNTIQRNDVQLSMGMRYDFFKGLSGEVKTQFQQSSNESRYHYKRESYYARDLVNRFSRRGTGNSIVRNVPAGGILDEAATAFMSANIRAQLNYTEILNKNLELAALGGAEIRKIQSATTYARTYGYDDERLTFGNVDYNGFYALWENLGYSNIYNGAGFDETTNRYVSYFGNAALTVRNKYIFSASARKDASNLFGVNTNQKWNPFWSVGAAWKISEERFYKSKWLPTLGARLTYGYSGNIIPGLSGKPVLSYSNNSVIPVPYASVNTAANPNLRWEKTGTLNLGVDMSIKSHRLSASFDYYLKRSEDLFATVPLDPTIGVRTQVLNAGNIKSNGFNVKINAIPVNGSIKWEVQLLADKVRNKVTRFFNESPNKVGYVGFSTGITALEGKDPYALISYRWAGLDPLTGDPRGYLNDTISKDYVALYNPGSFDQLVIGGSTRPKIFGSMRNTFSYKMISVSANITYAFDYVFRRLGMDYDLLYYSWAMNREFAQRWQQPGDELHTNVPSMQFPNDYRRDALYKYSEATVEKGDHIRLQDIQLQYRLNSMRTKHSFIKNSELTAYLYNIGILWRANKQKIDPAYGQYIPPSVGFSLGFRTNF